MSDFTAKVSGMEIELGMSLQNKSGIWCKPTVRMNISIDGGTDPKQAFDEVCDNIENVISEME